MDFRHPPICRHEQFLFDDICYLNNDGDFHYRHPQSKVGDSRFKRPGGFSTRTGISHYPASNYRRGTWSEGYHPLYTEHEVRANTASHHYGRYYKCSNNFKTAKDYARGLHLRREPQSHRLMAGEPSNGWRISRLKKTTGLMEISIAIPSVIIGEAEK
ncbi:unnamed protein product [Cuscuta europaea]|uniref:Uncharacterized protein n=1 Tax=Cuscuta europaea TaxID=41803 RepID=A0A9P0ZGA9_CUSEU|nr:unnamed protein product [Cuscuta europaea]